MKDRLLTIANAEGCSQQELSLVDEILEQAGGDMRRAVTTLQSVHSLALGHATITKDSIAEIAGVPPSAVVDQLWKALADHDDTSSKLSAFDRMQQAVEAVCAAGYSAQILLTALLPKVVMADDTMLNEMGKAEIAIRLAQAEKNMIEGADEYLQLMTVGSLAVTCFAKSREAASKQ